MSNWLNKKARLRERTVQPPVYPCLAGYTIFLLDCSLQIHGPVAPSETLFFFYTKSMSSIDFIGVRRRQPKSTHRTPALYMIDQQDPFLGTTSATPAAPLQVSRTRSKRESLRYVVNL